MMSPHFAESWNTAARTSVGLFWMAFWAFGFGYFVSSAIQVLVTREGMRRTMGGGGSKSIALGTVFGFASSSCSFAALATTRALFAKGAGLIPSLAFLLASTNLVIELGIVIAVFLSWQFVVGEYVGGLLLILLMWALVSLTRSDELINRGRENALAKENGNDSGDASDWRELIRSREGWSRIASRYVMEWNMVWKDVTIGFAAAGIIAAFVPRSFFQALFIGTGAQQPSFLEVALQAIVGPAAAFFTFIGSMGNIPLAAVLFGNGVTFAGVMAFIFSDLVVFPVVRIQAEYYGWKMALYILGVFLAVSVAAAVVLHYGFALAGMLPDPATATDLTNRQFFAIDHTFFLNLLFGGLTAAALVWNVKKMGLSIRFPKALGERVSFIAAAAAFAWLGVGLAL